MIRENRCCRGRQQRGLIWIRIVMFACFACFGREHVLGSTLSGTDNLDLPDTVLPACSAWRSDLVLQPSMSTWHSAFKFVDGDGDGLISVADVGWVFREYLLATGRGTADFGEDIRRVLEVIRSHPKFDVSLMEEIHIDWKGFSFIMSAYTTRSLPPSERNSPSRLRRMDMDMDAVARLANSAHSDQAAILQALPQEERFATYGGSLLLAAPEQRAAQVAMMSDHQRLLLLSRRQQRFDLSAVDLSIRSRRSGSANFTAINCSTGSYQPQNQSYCLECDSCPPGYFRSGCGGTSGGECAGCALGSVKNFTGAWNHTCIACPFGSSNREGVNVSACYFMYTCQQFRAAGYSTTGQYHLSLRLSPTRNYADDELVPWEADGVTPKTFESRLAYCDMATDGGGWMLILCYRRSIFDTDGRNDRELPLDPAACYSHLYLLRFSQAVQRKLSEVRLFCTSSEHNRTVHFKTSHQGPLGIARRGVTQWNEPSWWIGNTTLMSDHSGILPLAANMTQDRAGAQVQGADSLDDGFHNFPFFRPPDWHWAIRSNGRWECDNGERYYDSTNHQVWTR